MRRLRLLLLALCLGALPAVAATGLESARIEAQGARKKVSDVRSRQMQLRGELGALSSRIAALKAQQGDGALLPGSELEQDLRRSQELSQNLTQLAQELSALDAEAVQKNQALHQALTLELDALRTQWDRTQDRAAREQLVERMRKLRQEREQVRAALPTSSLPTVQTERSDDAEDLLEQADLLRDSEDKVRRQMQALKARIAELREEKDLDRRMDEFMGDSTMFDDQDRRLRVQRQSKTTIATGAQPPLGGGESTNTQDATTSATQGPATGTMGPGSGSAGPVPTGGTSFSSSGTTDSSPRAGAVTTTVKGVDARPQIGGGAKTPSDDASDDLTSLAAQLKKLESLAKDLDERASSIEAKAKGAQ